VNSATRDGTGHRKCHSLAVSGTDYEVAGLSSEEWKVGPQSKRFFDNQALTDYPNRQIRGHRCCTRGSAGEPHSDQRDRTFSSNGVWLSRDGAIRPDDGSER
jgi:hypothetical protein